MGYVAVFSNILLIEHAAKVVVIQLTVTDKGNYSSTKVCKGERNSNPYV